MKHCYTETGGASDGQTEFSVGTVKGIIEDYIRKLYEAIERTMTLMGE